MQSRIDHTPSSNTLVSVKGKTDRAYDTTNDLRGDRKFTEDFTSPSVVEVHTEDTETFKNPYERENPNAQNRNKPGIKLGSREDSLETDDE